MTHFFRKVQFLRTTALTLFATLVLTSCEDTLAPHDIAGMYVLETVGGSSLPALYSYFDDGTGGIYTRIKFADTLEFFTNGRGTMERSRYLWIESRNGESTETVITGAGSGFSYHISDGVIHLEPDAPSFALFSEATRGTSKTLIAPPDKPNYLSYIQRYFEATIGESGLVLDEVATESPHILAPREVYRRVR